MVNGLWTCTNPPIPRNANRTDILQNTIICYILYLKFFCYNVRCNDTLLFFKAKARQLVDQGITVIPVIIGDEVNKEQVEPTTDDEDRIVPVKPTDKPKDVTSTVDEKIKTAIKGKLPIYHDEQQSVKLPTAPPK